VCEDDQVQSFLARVVVSGIAIWIAAAIVPGVQLGEAPFTDQALTVLVVALIFGAVNAVLGPMLRVLTFPLFVLTLGLFSLVVNALLLWFTAWLAEQVNLAFSVAGFWAAFFGGLVVSLVTVLIGAVTRK
jgi:putative membrane protein